MVRTESSYASVPGAAGFPPKRFFADESTLFADRYHYLASVAATAAAAEEEMVVSSEHSYGGDHEEDQQEETDEWDGDDGHSKPEGAAEDGVGGGWTLAVEV